MIMRRLRPSDYTWTGIPGCAEGGQQQARRTAETQTENRGTDAANLSEQGEKLQDDMDALIDEIDEVLEENAEEFVKNYVQRGGE